MGNYDDWDQSSWGEDTSSSNQFDDGNDSWGGERQSATSPSPGSGGWHWLLTLVALVTVGVLSTGMAWLTRDVDERPVWMMGLIFMVPAAALMFAAMLVESATSAMTPGTSRRPQMIIAIAATVATFVVACICDWIYLSKFKKDPPVPAQSTVITEEDTDLLILICDPTSSMTESQIKVDDTIRQILGKYGSERRVGMIRGSEEIAPAKEQTDQLIAMAGRTPDLGRMYYGDLLKRALKMAQPTENGPGVRLVFLTDGRHPWTSDVKLVDLPVESCQRNHVTISCILFASKENDHDITEMETLVRRTNGVIVPENEWEAALKGMDRPRYTEQVSAAIIPKEVKLHQDLLRNRDPSAIIISFVMLILEGLSMGICLSLMMSVIGQFRAQFIISPLMGTLAAVLLKIILPVNDLSIWWMYEGLAFSLLGIVLMARNNRKGIGRRPVNDFQNNVDFDSTGF